MTAYIAILNRLRAELGLSKLASTQQSVCQALADSLQVHDAVNLCGHHGAGKTFAAWVWTTEWERWGVGRASYFPLSSSVRSVEGARVAVVDNLLPNREATRDATHTCLKHGYRKVVLITSMPAEDHLPKVELVLTHDDYAFVSETLRTLGYPCVTDDVRSLWEMTGQLKM